MQSLKLVAVGDSKVGKSCLYISYTTDSFPQNYVYTPTVFDNYSAKIMVYGSPYNVGLWDTAGKEDYDRLRPLSYPETDIFLMCYSVESLPSFRNIESRWYPEVKNYCPDAPIVIVATKTDLRGGQHTCVSREDGEKLAKKLGCPFAETSALTQDGLKDCFTTAVITSGKMSKNLWGA